MIPVSYWFQEEFESELRAIARNIVENAEVIRTLSEDGLTLAMFNALRFMAISAKHPGFGEEIEWRVVYCPTIQKSNVLVPFQTSVNGIPQTVYKIPLANIPEKNLIGLEIPELIDRVIVGPTQFPATISEALESALRKAGIENPETRVIASDIPIRH